jgi:acid phosphatase
LRYNDRPVTMPFCKLPGNHRAGDESFCTLTAFKEAADSFTPKDWKKECMNNLGEPAMPAEGVSKPLGL